MKTLIKIFICLSLIYTPMFANAANVGGWNLSNSVAQGASTVYDATKNVLINGKDFVKKSTVKITPTSSQVSKVLRGGVAGYALSVAVEQLLGAVDWVLDPANNSIVVSPPPPINQPPTHLPKYYKSTILSTTVYGATHSEACNAVLSVLIEKGYVNSKILYYVSPNTGNNECRIEQATATSGKQVYSQKIDLVNNTNITDPPHQEEKSYPLDMFSQQVISNAESSSDNNIKVGSQVATTAAAADIVAEAETDNTKARPIASQAEANAETKPADEAAAESANEATGTSKPNTADPEAMDLSLEFPVFCNWAPTICEAAQVVISFPQTLTGWWESANQKADDWATSISEAYQDFTKDDELPNDDTTIDVSEIPTPELQENAISWGASCPADVQIPINLQGVSSTITFSWSPWCQLLDIIKPAIIASAYIGAAFIVLGLRT